MAIDDSTNYTLTGAQVKDLAARIKAGGGGMIVYVDASFESPSSITNVFSDSGLTTVADWEDMADVILAGGTVIAVYDNGSNKHQYVELVSVTVNDNVAVGKRFAGVISSGVGETSPPLTIFLYYNDSLATPRWFAEGASLPTVNDATLTIQHNGTNVQTFTANQSTNATANIETIWADDIEATTPVPAVETAMIADGAVTAAKLADGAVTSAKIADGTIATGDIANGAITNAKIDWSTTSRPIYYRGQDWATSWTFSYNVFNPQLIFVAWQSSVAMFARIYDQIYKVFQNGGSTVTSSINTTNHTWTLSTSNTGVVNVLELRNTKTDG